MIIKKATFMYACVNTPKLGYKKKADPDNNLLNKEYAIDLLLLPAEYKKLKKSKYKKVKAIKGAREFTKKEFEKDFKFVPKEEYADEDGNYVVIKLRRSATYTDGKPSLVPLVGGIKGGKGSTMGKKDSEGQKVLQTTALGNGTIGDVQCKERLWDNEHGKGLSLDLIAVCVRNLVPYEKELEFDFEEDDDVDEDDSEEEGFDHEDDDDDDSDTDDSEEDEDDEGWDD